MGEFTQLIGYNTDMNPFSFGSQTMNQYISENIISHYASCSTSTPSYFFIREMREMREIEI